MAIQTLDQLISAMGNNTSRIIIDKASITAQTAGTFVSLWRATGQPGQGATPGVTAVCNNTTVGCFGFNQQTSPAASYIGYLECVTGNAAMTLEIHDRLAHSASFSGTVTTIQNITFDLASLTTNNMTERIGDSNYSDVQWWLEWYSATGSTAVNVTVNVTYNDGSTGSLTAASLAATRPASFMLPLNSLIPSAQSGKFIRGVTGVLLSATTGTAGSFGVTATRIRASLSAPIANMKFTADWAQLGFPMIANESCLFPIVITSTTSSGTIRGGGKIIHG